MKLDRLPLFLGMPIQFNGVEIFSPSIDSIAKIGESTYRLNFVFATFDKEKIIVDILGVSDSDYEEIESNDGYKVLTENPLISNQISLSISFFVEGSVVYNTSTNVFDYHSETKGGTVEGFINQSNYKEFVNVVSVLNGVEPEKEKVEFKNDRVKKKYKKMMELKNKFNKPNEFELKDVLSVICNSECNSISVFNISKLTIYQVYEHFERINILDNHKRTLALWANTYTLKEGTKLPEWIVKTKM